MEEKPVRHKLGRNCLMLRIFSKKKLYAWSKRHINSDNVKVILLLFPCLFFLVKYLMKDKVSVDEFIDVTVLVSFLLVFVCEGIAKLISGYVERKCEDAAKLTEDYKALVKKYSRVPLIEYKGCRYPETLLAFRRADEEPFELQISHDLFECQYNLPSQVAEHSQELMEVHSHSKVYNSMNVRLNECVQKGNAVCLIYSQTCYFDSMITNRAMDYEWSNGKSVREIYEPGPFLNSLKDSKLSNHLGFNGFVELEDGKLVFVIRNKDVSIGKGSLATSVGASYKTKYGLEDNRHMSSARMGNAIRCEIADELKIDLPKDLSLEMSIFAFYRDLLEGGKPQFLFYYRIPNLTVEEFEENFKEKNNSAGDDRDKVVVDGERFAYFTIEELRNAEFTINGFKIGRKEYRMMPSATVSVVLLLNHLLAMPLS